MAETGADEKVTASVIDTLVAAGHVEDADPDLAARLQFLVVETDVSGIWHAGRRERLAVHLSGIAVNVTLATAGLIAVLFGAPPLAFLGTVVFLAQVMLIAADRRRTRPASSRVASGTSSGPTRCSWRSDRSCAWTSR